MKGQVPKLFSLLLFFFFLSNYLTATNECPVATFWIEDFTGLANGTTSDAGTTAWTSASTGTSGTYSVQNNEFKVSYSGQQVSTFTSQVIDIANKTNVSFSVDLRSEVASTSDAFENSDYVRVYYKLNGGAETLAYEDLAGIGNTTNTTGAITFSSPSLSGSTLQIIIKASNSDLTERYFFDNIKVNGKNAATATVTGAVTCSASAQLSATAGSTVSAWSWTGPNGFTAAIQNPAVSAGGQYTVKATMTSGCIASSSITVTENKTAPDITATGGTLGCLSGITLNVNSSVSGATYSWTGPNNFSCTAKNPTVSVPGNYTATVTNPANGCTASQQVTVNSGGTTATLWNEDFTLSNGSTSDAGTTSWSVSTNPSTTLFSVLNNEFRVSNSSNTSGAEGVWTSGAIDITGKTNVTISAGVRSAVSTGAEMDSDPTWGDYIRFYYKLNNGTEVLFAEKIAGINNHSTTPATVAVTGLSGTSLRIVVRARATGNDEFYYFDNVQATGTTLPPVNAVATATNILSCTNNTVGLTGSSATSGASYKWTGPNNYTATTQNASVTAAGIYTLTVTDPSTGCTGNDTALVTLNNTTPGACASVSGPLTCNSGSSATLSGSSGTSGVSYSWTGPNNYTSTTQNPAVSTVGSYTLTVTNPVNGCTSSASTAVTFSNTITGTAWLEDFTLANGATSDAGTTSWSVSTNPSTTLFSVLNNEFRVSNSSNASGAEGVWTSGAIDITGKTNVTISAGVRSAVSTGAEMDSDPTWGDYIRFYYKLNNGAEVLFAEKIAGINNHSTTPTTVTVTGLSGTNIRIVVRARATGNDEFYYFDNVQVVTAANVSANATGGAINCTANSVTLQGSASSPGASYNWSGPNNYSSTTQNPVVTVPGTYTLTAALGSCNANATATVSRDTSHPAITASANPLQLTCVATSSTLSGGSATPGVNYSWSNAGGVIANTASASITTPGTYTLTVTNPTNGCTAARPVAVTQNISAPTGVTATHTGIVTCINPISVVATVSSSGANYSWSGPNGFSATTLNASTTHGGTYIFTATNPATGCTATASTIVEENTTPPGGISINNSGTITCLNNSVTISGSSSSSGVNYQWQGPNGYSTSSTSATVKKGGIYTLTATNPVNGCTSSKSTTVAENTVTPVLTVGNTSPLSCAHPTVTLSATTNTPNVSYLWLGPDGFVDVASTTTTSAAGDYFITVTDPANGCNTTDYTAVTEDYSDCGARKATTTATARSAEQHTPVASVSSFTYKAYPNPVITNGVIELTSPQNTQATVSLYNALGTCEKILFKGAIAAGRLNRIAIPAVQLHAGAYFYIINADGKTYTGKLVIVQ